VRFVDSKINNHLPFRVIGAFMIALVERI
jgi:hypothetical protein